MSEPARIKIREVAGRIEKTPNLAEDFIRESWMDLPPEESGREFFDLTEDIVEPVLEEPAPEIRDRQTTLVNWLDHRRGGDLRYEAQRGGLNFVISLPQS